MRYAGNLNCSNDFMLDIGEYTGDLSCPIYAPLNALMMTMPIEARMAASVAFMARRM